MDDDWKDLLTDHEKVKAEQSKSIKFVNEAARVFNKKTLRAFNEHLDLRGRPHITPWPNEPRHKALDLDCWCRPSEYKGVIIHWDLETCDKCGRNQMNQPAPDPLCTCTEGEDAAS